MWLRGCLGVGLVGVSTLIWIESYLRRVWIPTCEVWFDPLTSFESLEACGPWSAAAPAILAWLGVVGGLTWFARDEDESQDSEEAISSVSLWSFQWLSRKLGLVIFGAYLGAEAAADAQAALALPLALLAFSTLRVEDLMDLTWVWFTSNVWMKKERSSWDVVIGLAVAALATRVEDEGLRVWASLPFIVTAARFTSQAVALQRENLALLHSTAPLLCGVLGATLTSIWSAESARRARRVGLPIARFASFYTFHWIYPTLRRPEGITAQDLPSLPESLSPEALGRRFEALLPRDVEEVSPLALLDLSIRRIQPENFYTSLAHGFVFLACMLADPLLIHALLSGDQTRVERDVFLCVALFVSMLLRVTCMEICFFYSVRTMACARSAWLSVIFSRALAEAETGEDPAGLASNDADKMGASGWVVFFLAQWIWSVVTLPLTLYVLSRFVGWSAAGAGILVVVLGGSLSRALGARLAPYYDALRVERGARVSALIDAVRTMISIKLSMREEEVVSEVERMRARELEALWRVRVVTSMSAVAASLASLSVPVVIFFVFEHVSPGTPMTPAVAFGSLASIGQISWSVSALPEIVNLWASLAPSARALATFLRNTRAPPSEERVERASEWDLDAEGPSLFRMSEVFVYAGSTSSRRVLRCDETLEIVRGDLVLVRGPTGSGKSSLLALIAGARGAAEEEESMSVVRPSWASVAYVPSTGFLFSGTIRENVVFGSDSGDPDRLRRSLERARLSSEVARLRRGVDALVGERGGAQLSGGQRARVALARALYADPDLLVLDDVFASLDAKTSRAIRFDVLIEWIARDKRRALVMTSRESETELETRVEAMGGRVVYVTLHPGSDPDQVGRMTIEHRTPIPRSETLASRSEVTASADLDAEPEEEEREETENDGLTLRESVHATRAALTSQRGRVLTTGVIDRVEHELLGVRDDDERDNTTRETRSGVAWTDVAAYLGRFGGDGPLRRVACVGGIAGSLLVGAATEVGSPWFLAEWTGEEERREPSPALVYAGIGLASAVVGALVGLLTTLGGMSASRDTHREVLRAVLGAPMSVFDSTSTGKFVNGLSSDVRSIDESVPDALVSNLKRIVLVLLQCLVIAWTTSTSALWLVPVVLPLYVFVLCVVRAASRDVKRVEAEAHAPVYAWFLDALKGRETVRAFRAEKRFREVFHRRVHVMTNARVASEAVSKWAQTVTVQLGAGVYLGVALMGVCWTLQRADSARVGYARVGLMLTLAATLQRTGMDFLMGWTAMETSLISVERAEALTRLPREEESEEDVSEEESAGNAPAIRFHRVSFRYRVYRPLILRDVSFEVRRGEKVCVCGRTGSGKSSLLAVMLKLYPLFRGRVELSGRDVRGWSTRRVRELVAVVAQDAILPYTTLRACLSGREGSETKTTDLELALVLREVGLERFVGRLEMDVSAASSGERQLIGIARALLLRRSMCFLDESTANVDPELETRVQRALLGMRDTTVVSVMHRLQTPTLMEFDRVLVMESGAVAQVGAPRELIAVDGLFRRLVESARGGVDGEGGR